MSTVTNKIVAIIPARMAATRFPDKPLARLLGLTMLEHIWRRVNFSPSITDCFIATCDEVIRQAVTDFGGKVIMTSDRHDRCTDRIAEAANQIKADIIVNVQGDEPLITPDMITAVIQPLLDDPTLPSVNLVSPILSETEFNDPNAPKVVMNLKGDLLYISREAIPSRKKYSSDDYVKLKQLGIMAFRSDFLQIFTRLAPTPLEMIESVDMNRAVEHGYRVKMVTVTGQLVGVDVPADIARAEALLKIDPWTQRYLD